MGVLDKLKNTFGIDEEDEDELDYEDGNISFKLYEQISSMEKERNEAIRAVDELLLAMEG